MLELYQQDVGFPWVDEKHLLSPNLREMEEKTKQGDWSNNKLIEYMRLLWQHCVDYINWIK